MRAWLAICAVALTACVAEPEAVEQLDVPTNVNVMSSTASAQNLEERRVAIEEHRRAEIEKEFDTLLDKLEANILNRESGTTDYDPTYNLREYRALLQQIQPINSIIPHDKPTKSQQARFDALTGGRGKPSSCLLYTSPSPRD